ncbi:MULTISPECIES: hypothetical protein [unclassified Shinella]|uniref:hypothetical protein n=1 Tax=unclassified Shinella TaxID=2643062 RepID=UPI00068087BB|nr:MULTISPECIES: hypothetical protein [unclassified Shinella]
MSADTANNFMRVATVYGDKYRTVRDLPPTALYELAAPKTPPEVREEIERMIEAGEVVTKATVARLRADKAAALASYAKQAKDDELMKRATRIRDRAIRRAGELLKQIEPQKGGDRKSGQYQKGGTSPLITRKEAAEHAGLSPDQAKQAIRVANVPAAEFERQVESPKPPTITTLAEQGVQKRDFDTKALTFSPLRWIGYGNPRLASASWRRGHSFGDAAWHGAEWNG